ncbi:MAG: type II toxin-antitoxin system prevent-host-death family antitoxin [Alphaproteobacteria bacterium]|jgi:prevent-host-death family protein|nr:type II toxin-antitoxin system prevent-host-death family antitoxin [Alphaproteobacteria bacterium]MBU2041305.1 type II toxin-antitoxin system prevent-host-death family antitoxin [Alphaproteobacteria bacterium]MBU2127061.1 type II toxin-antitoxin system prevent-host-death family antitoxin [Alphaproteobacteria bacterium]MBU2208558.1 type II toxin-antitoxin system prevent-host-death family antitoxin [Alphaproteobacteria bacterium]MBU2291010.1 type II toxin-antitoxin system prevent-host-death fa
MSHYSVAEAKNNLPKLLDRMLAGEEVVITRRGKPIARLAPETAPEPGFPLDLEWLDANRVTPAKGPIDTAAVVAEMRRGYRY